MADRYWVGGAGTWNTSTTTNWSATSGGAGGASVPTSADNVFFNSASSAATYTVTVSGTVSCANITITAPSSGNVIISGGTINIYGSISQTSSTANLASQLVFLATSPQTIDIDTTTSAALVTTFNSATGSWTLLRSLVLNTVTLTAGTLDTGGFNVTMRGLFNVASGGTLNLSTSRLIFDYISGVTLDQSLQSNPYKFITINSAATLSAASATCVVNPKTFASGVIVGGYNKGFFTVDFGGKTFGTLEIIFGSNSQTGVSEPAGRPLTFICPASSFTSLTTSISDGNTGVVTLSSNNSGTGVLTATSGGIRGRVRLESSVPGTARTLTLSSASVTSMDFLDITIAGAAAPISGTNIGNMTGCTGITFTAAKNVYWNLTGTQTWSANGWTTTSGGAPSSTVFPLAQDTVIFDNTGAVTTINTDGSWAFPSVTMASRTSAMTIGFSGFFQNIIVGSWTNGSGTTLSSLGALVFAGSNTQNLTSAGKTFPSVIVNKAPGTSLTLLDAFTSITGASSASFTLTYGTLTTGGFTFTPAFFSSNNSNTRAIALGSGSITLPELIVGAGTQWDTSTVTNLTVTGTSPTINYTVFPPGTPTTRNSMLFGSPTEANAFNYVVTNGCGPISGNLRSLTVNSSSPSTSGTLSGSITLYGDVSLVSGTIVSGLNITMAASTGTKNVTIPSTSGAYNLTINTTGGTIQPTTALALNGGSVTLTAGTFNTANFSITAATFSSSNTNVRALGLGSSTFTLTSTGTVWNAATATNLTITSGTSTILLSDTSTTARTFAGGGATYGNLTIGGSAGTSTLTITGANTFARLASTKTVAHTIIFPDATTTIGAWSIQGAPGKLVTIQPTTTSFTLAKSGSGIINSNYLSITNSNATPANTWYAGGNSVDGGGNTGWLFFGNAGGGNFMSFF